MNSFLNSQFEEIDDEKMINILESLHNDTFEETENGNQVDIIAEDEFEVDSALVQASE